MRTGFRQGAPEETSADTLCVGLFEGEKPPQSLDQALGGRLSHLVESGEAKGSFKKTAVVHAGDSVKVHRVIVVGLGKRDEFDAEQARIAAAAAFAKARDAGTRALCWAMPEGTDQVTIAAALTEGVLLAAYKFDRYKTAKEDSDGVQELEVSAADDAGGAVSEATIVAEAQNVARDLQNLPGNELTPTALAEHAVAVAAEIDGLECEVLGPDRIRELGMGGLIAVAQGSYEEPRLIVLRYAGAAGAPVGFIGKAVTFDTGGISIKSANKMDEMKMDMSGGASVIQATVAIARLGIPVNLLTVVPSTENMPSGRAVKPGDIIRIMNGKTVEVNNTDAEGRLILADALAWSAAEGAARLIDLATLTGAIISALGTSYAGLFSNDDDLARAVQEAGRQTGEESWRMPLHPDYKDLTRGKVADLTNASEARKAASAYAASFLEEFVDGKPWVHLDIAGTAWDRDNRDYVGKGASGWGVRLLVELARSLAAGKP